MHDPETEREVFSALWFLISCNTGGLKSAVQLVGSDEPHCVLFRELEDIAGGGGDGGVGVG